MNKLDYLLDKCIKSGIQDEALRKLLVKEARSAILKLVREMMPEKREEFGGTHADVQMAIGFNQAIDLIESKLKELES